MMRDEIDRLAAALADAWRKRTAVQLPAASDAPTLRQEAFAVQHRMACSAARPSLSDGWAASARGYHTPRVPVASAKGESG